MSKLTRNIKLGKIGKVLMCKRVLKHQTLSDGDIPFYKISTFGGQADTYISKELYNDFKAKFSFPKKGDILISAAGTLGKTVIYDGKPAYFQDSNIVWIDNDESIVLNSFLYYFYQTKPWVTTNGSTINRIYNENLRNINLTLPDLPTQKSIAKVLSDLDAKIELNNRINRELEAMAKTLYDYWFVQFDFPVRTLSGVEGYKSSGGRMVYNAELKREIPEGWEVGNLEDLGTIIGGSTPSKANSDYFTIGVSTPWITPKDLSLNKGNKFITRGEFDVTSPGIKNASLKLMPKGTVLLSSRAPIGYLAISRETVTSNQGFKSFVPNKDFSTYFIFYTVQKMIPTIINNAVGSTFKEVSGTTLKSIKISIPSKPILEEFDKKVSSIFKRQDLLEIENQQLTELRDWLLPMLMNGQVVSTSSTNSDTSTTKLQVPELVEGMAAEPSVEYNV